MNLLKEGAMTMTDFIDDASLPPLIRVHITNNLMRVARAPDLAKLDLALEHAEGFVEGVEASLALNPAAIQELFVVLEHADSARREELAT